MLESKFHYLFSKIKNKEAILIALFAFILYLGSLNHGFVWDDQIVITQNTYTTKGIEGLKDIWTKSVYILQRPTYRPITQSLFALEWEFFENNPKVFHLIQLALYSFCCFSVVFGVKHFFPKINNWLILFLGLFFVLTPIHVEVVANIKSADELLSAIFVIWALILSYKTRKFYKILALILFSFAILSKISAITLSPIFLFLFFKENHTIKPFVLKLSELNKYWEALTLLLFAAFIHFRHQELIFLIPLLILIYLIKININKIIWVQAICAIIIIVILRFYTTTSITLFIALLWYFQLNDKRPSLKNIPLNFILIFGCLGLVENISSVPFLFIGIYLAFVIYKINENKKLILLSSLLPVAYIIFLIFQTSFADKFEFLTIIKGVKSLILFSTPIIYFLLHTHLRKQMNAILFVILLFIVFVKTDFEYIKKFNNEVESLNKTDVIIPQENVKFANQPFHNILVDSKNNYEKAATICRIQLIYLQKLIFPTSLVHQYGTWQITLATWKDWDVYLSILIHVLLLWLAYYFYKQKFYIAMWGILWYFFAISIYTNIFRLMPDTLAERFLFLPSIGFVMAFVSGLYFFIHKVLKAEKKSILILGILLTPLFSYYAYKTIDRNKDWKDNYTLAANTLPDAENNAAINAQYAMELNNLVKYDLIQNKDSAQVLVVKHFKKALAIYPEFYGPNADLASYYILKTQPDSAFQYLKEAARMMPEEWIHHYYLGLIYYEKKKYADAIPEFVALQNNATMQSRPLDFPELLEAYEFGARCLHNLGRDPEAYQMLEEGITVFQARSTYILLANLYRTTGKGNEAIKVFKRLLSFTPEDQELKNTIEFLEKGLIY